MSFYKFNNCPSVPWFFLFVAYNSSPVSRGHMGFSKEELKSVDRF